MERTTPMHPLLGPSIVQHAAFGAILGLMRGRLTVSVVGLCLAGCPSTTTDSPRPTTSAPQAHTPAASSTPPLEGTAELTHLAPPPARAPSTCKPLAPGGSDATRQLAAAIRKLACEPELYYLPVSEVRRQLDLPGGAELRFNGPRSLELRLDAPPPARDVARVAGLEKPVITTAKRGAWAVRSWYLGANPMSGELDLWGPGRALVGVKHQREPEDTTGTVKPLGSEVLTGWISITMPADVVVVKDDALAVTMLQRAAEALADGPELLSREPADVAKAVGLDDPRFRVSRRSLNKGGGAFLGIDIWTARTQLDGQATLAALGIEGTVEPEKAHDSDDYVLTSGSDARQVWRGVHVELAFEPREGVSASKTSAAKDFVLERLTIMPGPGK